MKKTMKRRQFHLAADDEQILKEIASKKGISEAEVVRIAIRGLKDRDERSHNSLVKMAHIAEKEQAPAPGNLSSHHDEYLTEIITSET